MAIIYPIFDSVQKRKRHTTLGSGLYPHPVWELGVHNIYLSLIQRHNQRTRAVKDRGSILA